MAKQSSIEDLVGGAQALVGLIAEYDSKKAKFGAELASMNERIRAKLKKGETTGDRLQDLVLKVGGGIGNPLLPKLRNLEKFLKGKRGEFVLLHFDAEVPERHTFGKGYSHRNEECYRLGVLEGEELVIAEDKTGFTYPYLALPVSKYLQGRPFAIMPDEADLRNKKVEHSNIFTRKLGGFHDGNPKSLVELLQLDDWSRAMIIGDEAVTAWLKERAMDDLFKLAAVVLGKMAPEQSAEVYG